MDQMYDLEVMERESKREGLHRGGAAPRELRVRNATLGRRGLGLVGAVSPVWVIVMHGSLSSSAPTSVCLPAALGSRLQTLTGSDAASSDLRAQTHADLQ